MKEEENLNSNKDNNENRNKNNEDKNENLDNQANGQNPTGIQNIVISANQIDPSSINNNQQENKKEIVIQSTSFQIQNESQMKIAQIKKESEEAINRLLAKIEIQEAFSNAYQLEKEALQNKIKTMKQAIQELHTRFEIELNKKGKIFMDKVASMTKQIEEMKNKEGDYIKTILTLDNMNKTLQENISSISKKKMDLEDVAFRQEDRLSILTNRVNEIEQLLSKKNRMIKENEAYAIELIAIVEEQKKEIKKIKSKNKGDISAIHYQDNNDLANQVKNLKKELDEKNKRIRLYEADTSAIYLKSNNNHNPIKEVDDEGSYQNNNDFTGVGNWNKSFNEGSDMRGVNANANGNTNTNSNENTYLPLIGVKNNQNTGREKIEEFKSMMNNLIEEMNE